LSGYIFIIMYATENNIDSLISSFENIIQKIEVENQNPVIKWYNTSQKIVVEKIHEETYLPNIIYYDPHHFLGDLQQIFTSVHNPDIYVLYETDEDINYDLLKNLLGLVFKPTKNARPEYTLKICVNVNFEPDYSKIDEEIIVIV
jgi:hypothetical protein